MVTGARRPSERQIEAAATRVRTALEEHGLLLCHDARLPCATQLIAGEWISGSWWGHPKGVLIYEALGRSIDSETLEPKLLGGKLTLLHSRLWSALVAVACSEQPFQTEALRGDARHVLATVRKQGRVRQGELTLPPGSRKLAQVVSDLERRLLVYTDSMHTETGEHQRMLSAWPSLCKALKIRQRDLPKPETALDQLSRAAERWGSDVASLLPWRRKTRR